MWEHPRELTKLQNVTFSIKLGQLDRLSYTSHNVQSLLNHHTVQQIEVPSVISQQLLLIVKRSRIYRRNDRRSPINSQHINVHNSSCYWLLLSLCGGIKVVEHNLHHIVFLSHANKTYVSPALVRVINLNVAREMFLHQQCLWIITTKN